jgi:hypothetical protein
MTRDEAIGEAERRQRSHPDAKWIATQGNEWVVARIGLAPTMIKPTGAAMKPPPVTQDDPQSALQRVTTLYGSSG